MHVYRREKSSSEQRFINQRVTPYQHVQVEDGLEMVLPVQRERCSHVLGGGGGGVTYDLGGGWWW